MHALFVIDSADCIEQILRRGALIASPYPWPSRFPVKGPVYQTHQGLTFVSLNMVIIAVTLDRTVECTPVDYTLAAKSL